MSRAASPGQSAGAARKRRNSSGRVTASQPPLPAVTPTPKSLGQARGAAVVQHGAAPLVAGLLVELNVAIRTGLIREDYDLHPPVMGKVKLEDFAREFALAFK